jgi:hypothetical protein
MKICQQVKKERRKAKNVNPDIQECYPTVYQHFAELLVSMPASLFAQDWKKCDVQNDCKTPHNDVNYVFGMMMHETEV